MGLAIFGGLVTMKNLNRYAGGEKVQYSTIEGEFRAVVESFVGSRIFLTDVVCLNPSGRRATGQRLLISQFRSAGGVQTD